MAKPNRTNQRQQLLESFPPEDREAVQQALATIKDSHTMGGGVNLNNTITAALTLAKGDLKQLLWLVDQAKVDFRDLVMWYLDAKKDSPKT